MDSNLPVFDVHTQAELIDQLLFQERMIAKLSGFFGILALALACIGLYGLLSYEVSRRTREIGIRMALGAQRRGVLRLIVGQGILLAISGAIVGIGVTLGVTRYLKSMLYDAGDRPATIRRGHSPYASRGRGMLHSRAPRHARRSNGRAAVRIAHSARNSS